MPRLEPVGRWWLETHGVPVPAWWGFLQGQESQEDPKKTPAARLCCMWISSDVTKVPWGCCGGEDVPPAPVAALGLPQASPQQLWWETGNGEPRINPVLPPSAA